MEIELIVNPVGKVLRPQDWVSCLLSSWLRVDEGMRRTLSIAWNFFSALPYSFRRRKLQAPQMRLKKSWPVKVTMSWQRTCGQTPAQTTCTASRRDWLSDLPPANSFVHGQGTPSQAAAGTIWLDRRMMEANTFVNSSMQSSAFFGLSARKK